jgi:hypothetical protein
MGAFYGVASVKFFRIASYLPVVWVVGVFAFYLRARAHLGFWPTPAFPDPKSLPFEFHHWILMIAVFPIAWTVFLLPISWLMRIKRIGSLLRREVAPYLAGWALVAIIMFSSGKNFIAWFLD